MMISAMDMLDVQTAQSFSDFKDIVKDCIDKCVEMEWW